MTGPQTSQQPRKPFPAEDAVEDAVRAWLKEQGYGFERRDYVDIVARGGDPQQLWVIEAKGHTKDPGLDFRTCLGQIISAMHDDGAVYAVAAPATPAYRRLCSGISDHVRRALGLHWLLVDRNLMVWHITPDQKLPEEAFAQEPV